MNDFLPGIFFGTVGMLIAGLLALSALNAVIVEKGLNGQPDTVRYKGVVYVLVKADIKETDDHSVPKD